jgi:hypothetical protein
MPKRVTWFVVGAVAGAGGTAYVRRKARQAIGSLQPDNVARVASTKVRNTGRGVLEAVREGRAAMLAKEAELRAVQGDALVPPAGGSPTIVVFDSAALLDADEYRLHRSGPRRRSRR